jgi:prepilin-type processing-associated H-X9-DG protein
MLDPLSLVLIGFALLAVVLVIAAVAAVRRRRWIGTSAALTLGLLCLALAALAATLSVATRGYRALTREVVAAVVVTRPTGPDRFTATFVFPDGRQASYELTGNALYVDGHIVKWHPLANVLGLHTAYQLDRVGGRYDRIDDERRKPRRIFTLSTPRPVEMIQLARSFAFLGRVVDAKYGSATFVPAQQTTRLELRVSTSGLLFRRADRGA